MTDYQRGRDNLGPTEGTDWSQYNRGQGDRAGGGSGSGGYGAIYGLLKSEYRKGRIKFYVRWLLRTAKYSAVAALVAGGVAFLMSPAQAGQWAVMGAAAIAGLSLIILVAFLVGVTLGFAINVVAMAFLLWRWLLAFGVFGAGAGYLVATLDHSTSSATQQRAVEYALWGLLAGLVLGTLSRIVRGLRAREARG